MITPAIFEDAMEQHKQSMKCNLNKEYVLKKASEDVLNVLKQFGYDAGADIFAELVEKGCGNHIKIELAKEDPKDANV